MRRLTPRRAAFATAALSFLLVVGASASTVPPASTAERSGPSFFADAVYVYQNGFCQVLDTIWVDVVDGSAELELPDGTVFDTLRVEGADVHQVILREDSPTVLPGDRVRLRLGDGVVEGRVLEVGEFWGIDSDNGTRYIRADQIRSFEVLGAVAPTPGTTHVTLRMGGPDGPRELKVSYIVRGLGWTPTYEVDVEAKRLREWVTFRSPATIDADRLVLVVGAPSMVFMHRYDTRTFEYAGLTVAADSASAPSWEAGSFDHFHEYTLNQSFRFEPGQTVRVHFLEGPIDLEQELVAHVSRWSGETTAQVEWTFTNRFEQPLAGGVVSFYRAGRIIGQDHMPYLARNDDVRLTSGTQRDLVVSTTGTCAATAQWRFEIEAANRDDEAHILFVRFTYGASERPEGLDPTPWRRDPNVILWRLDLDADQQETIRGRADLPRHDNGECR